MVSRRLFRPQSPLKNFQYNQSTTVIGKITHGPGNLESIPPHANTPTPLTNNPDTVTLTINGTLFHMLNAEPLNLICCIIIYFCNKYGTAWKAGRPNT